MCMYSVYAYECCLCVLISFFLFVDFTYKQPTLTGLTGQRTQCIFLILCYMTKSFMTNLLSLRSYLEADSTGATSPLSRGGANVYVRSYEKCRKMG